jgi:hypothetical protein
VFMDAHNTVTVEEGDRYPLRPPSFVIPDAVQAEVVSSSAALSCYSVVRLWDNKLTKSTI